MSVDLSVTLRPPKVDHVRALAGVIGRVPLILVHRATGRVVDGHHRVLAAARAALRALVESGDDRPVRDFVRRWLG